MKALAILLCAAAALCAQTVQRTIQDNPIARGNDAKAPGDTGAPAPGQALESIFASSEDLNAIRDGYLRRLSGDGCPTDVSIHIAELRAWLRDLESDTPSEIAAKAKPTTPQTSAEMELALLALAATWKDRGLAEAAIPVSSRDAERARMLSLVLPAAVTPATSAQPSSAAQLRSEIARLMEGCKAAKP
jgi:hypothetical protein